MYTTSEPVSRVLSSLKPFSGRDGQWQACCPAHDDKNPSLSVSQGRNGKVLLCCHAGCEIEQITAALGIEVRDLFERKVCTPGSGRDSGILRAYDYKDLDGHLLYQVCRMVPIPGNPRFLQRRPYEGTWAWGLTGGYYKKQKSGEYHKIKKDEDRPGAVKLPAVKKILYRLTAVQKAIENERWIVICEGEKDADNGAALGLTTTTYPGGAGKWLKSYSTFLKGARVGIVPHNDAAGQQGAEKVARSLREHGLEVRIVDLEGQTKGFDLFDWIEQCRSQGLADREIREGLIAKIESTPPRSPKSEGLPVITLDTDEMKVVDEAVDALANRLEIYHRGGVLVHIVHEEITAPGIIRPPTAPTIQTVAGPRVREVLSAAANWRSDDDSPSHPPLWVVQALMARGNWPELRLLEGVVESPILRPDGSILAQPGYDKDTGLFFQPNGSYLPMPKAPGRDDAIRAAASLLDVVADFPFADDMHRSAWLSAVLTVFARFAYRGPAPLHLIDANVPGAGKSLLADLIAMITLGRSAARMAPSEKEAEERKRITALAIAGDPLVLIDNVSRMLGSAALDAALTAEIWSDRLLGQNLQLKLPLNMIWLATGNNVSLRGDTSRRCVHIRLESPDEFPERRGGFRHPRILEWVAKERPRLVADALTILKAYVHAGKPSQGLSPWGSYEGWSQLARNAIVWVGLPDPGETREALQTEANQDHEMLEGLVDGWAEAVEAAGKPLCAAEVIEMLQADEKALPVLRSAILELCSSPGPLPNSRVLGNRIKRFKDHVINGRALTLDRKANIGKRWIVKAVPGRPKSDSSDLSDSSGHPQNFSSTMVTPEKISWECSTESPDSLESPLPDVNDTQIGTIESQDLSENRDLIDFHAREVHLLATKNQLDKDSVLEV